MSQESVTLHELAETCSTRERAAEAAERDMSRLRAISWLKHRVGERFSGMVTSVRDQGFMFVWTEFLWMDSSTSRNFG